MDAKPRTVIASVQLSLFRSRSGHVPVTFPERFRGTFPFLLCNYSVHPKMSLNLESSVKPLAPRLQKDHLETFPEMTPPQGWPHVNSTHRVRSPLGQVVAPAVSFWLFFVRWRPWRAPHGGTGLVHLKKLSSGKPSAACREGFPSTKENPAAQTTACLLCSGNLSVFFVIKYFPISSRDFFEKTRGYILLVLT